MPAVSWLCPHSFFVSVPHSSPLFLFPSLSRKVNTDSGRPLCGGRSSAAQCDALTPSAISLQCTSVIRSCCPSTCCSNNTALACDQCAAACTPHHCPMPAVVWNGDDRLPPAPHAPDHKCVIPSLYALLLQKQSLEKRAAMKMLRGHRRGH